MKIPDQQLALFEQRLQAIGLGRRDFLKAVGAMAAFGGLGFATTAHAYKPTKPAPGDKLAKEQVFRFGGGGYYQNDPASMDFNKDLYCSGVPALFAGLMVFNPDFVAEPWAIGGNSYQVGNFPGTWAEWNGAFRDTFRKDQNQMGVENVTPGDLATRFAGSSDLYGDDGRKPFNSINFMVAHDGFTLKDLYSCNTKNNTQAWPYGPSDGGEDNNNSWTRAASRPTSARRRATAWPS